MLYLFYGNDIVTVREKAHDFVLKQEQEGKIIQYIEPENYSQGVFADMVGSVSLFGEEKLFVIDTPSEKEEMYKELISYLEVFSLSDTLFVIIEKKLTGAEKNKFKKYAQTIQEYKINMENFNTFALADCFARRDKKNLWFLLQEAKESGTSIENIIGILWWQLKSMRIAKQTTCAKEAGMKDYPYNKAKRAISAFKEGELERLSMGLLTVYHEGHLGKVDIDIALEQWVLTL